MAEDSRSATPVSEKRNKSEPKKAEMQARATVTEQEIRCRLH